MIGCGIKKGTSIPIHKKFSEIEKGDHIVYYATGDMVLIGIFEVISERDTMHNDEDWGDRLVYHIKPAFMPNEDYFVDWKELLFEQDVSFDLFPVKERWQFKIWNKYIHPLSQADYELIKKGILSHKYETTIETKEKTIFERLGPAFGTIDLLFEPVDEMGVVYLFAKHHREIGFPFIVKLRSKYPDVVAIDMKGERKLLELEFRSSNFNHDPKGCDFIVCWIDDLDAELKKKLPKIIDLSKTLSSIYSKHNSMQ